MGRMYALVLGVALALLAGCDDATSVNDVDSSSDGSLPPCKDGEKADGITRCDPIETADAGADAGSPITDGGTDATDSSTTDTEASDDAEVTTDEGTPEECPPAAIPNGTNCDGMCTIYWDNSSGACLSDCEGVISPPRPPERIAILCGLGDAN